MNFILEPFQPASARFHRVEDFDGKCRIFRIANFINFTRTTSASLLLNRVCVEGGSECLALFVTHRSPALHLDPKPSYRQPLLSSPGKSPPSFLDFTTCYTRI